ncbi:unnamed protein product, partial [Ectocarpus sp. 12 AP-2014]
RAAVRPPLTPLLLHLHLVRNTLCVLAPLGDRLLRLSIPVWPLLQAAAAAAVTVAAAADAAAPVRVCAPALSRARHHRRGVSMLASPKRRTPRLAAVGAAATHATICRVRQRRRRRRRRRAVVGRPRHEAPAAVAR